MSAALRTYADNSVSAFFPAADLARVSEAVAEIRKGGKAVVCSDQSGKIRGDVVLAAEFATATSLNWFSAHARGVARLAITEERCEALGLERWSPTNGGSPRSPVTVPIDAERGISSGGSAVDRAHTIAAAIAVGARPEDLVHGGHVFPIVSSRGGVLERPGSTEAAVDLARLAGLRPAAVVCAVNNHDGTAAELGDLVWFAARHGCKLLDVRDLVAYRKHRDPLAIRAAAVDLPTAHGQFRAVGYEAWGSGAEFLALIKGNVQGAEAVPLHFHRACLTGDALHSLSCDCEDRLVGALRSMDEEGFGVLVYLPEAGFRLDHASVGGPDDLDDSDAEIAAHMLRDLAPASVCPVGMAAKARDTLTANGLAISTRSAP